ncbi:MAG: PHP domain-containing protein [Elusimicrobiota bacterium]|jgi:predicted metal-dependent phosphoesterase TrpH|nr:PHP domain-containing protein [Elusimicrobiota bacterium]
MSGQKFVDLHLHTIFSDGTWTPESLVEAACERNLSAIAVTDHDTIDGVKRAKEAAKTRGLEVVAGVELSSFIEGEKKEAHILGYFFNDDYILIKKELDIFKQDRLRRAYEMLNKLAQCGIALKDISFLKQENRSVGRFHFAKAIVESGYANTTQGAFEKYIGIGKPCYVGKKMLAAHDAIKLIKKYGGIPVCAHPYYLNDRVLLGRLADEGLMGIEVWHSKHSSQMKEFLLGIAKSLNLIATGGSDCHGGYKKDPPIIASQRVDYEVLENLKKAAGVK